MVPVDAAGVLALLGELELELELDELLLPQPASASAPTRSAAVGRRERDRRHIDAQRYRGHGVRGAGATGASVRRVSDAAPMNDFPMTTALELPGTRVRENIGVCYGLVVRSMGFAGSMSASFKALRRGEISQYCLLYTSDAADE